MIEKPDHPIRELVGYFLRLGTLGFGGPVALVGQMERELVTERGWLTKDELREVIAVCQSLPGPLAIQVGIFISYLRGGFWGAWAGGWAFILPNFLIVAALGALYVHFGGLQPVTAIFYGVSPAVIALILHSCYRLAKLGMEDALQWAIAGACFLVTVILQAEVALLFIGAGTLGLLWYGTLLRRPPSTTTLLVAVPAAPIAKSGVLAKILLFFLKAGALTFGSGLVIVPFLAAGSRAGARLARRARISHRRCHWHDQPRSRGHYRDLRRLLGRRVLGRGRGDHRHLLAVFSSDSHCGTHLEAPSRQQERARVC